MQHSEMSSIPSTVGMLHEPGPMQAYVGQSLFSLLQHHRLKKWGFIIYRCTYDDDDAWSRLMTRLNELCIDILRREPHGEALIACMDWRVEQDRGKLDGASKDEVRRQFRALVTSSSLIPDELHGPVYDEFDPESVARLQNPRRNFCVHVDAEALASVVREIDNGAVSGRQSGHVNFIRADEGWVRPDFDRFDWATYCVDPDDEDGYDEGEEEIEGSRLEDVGWMMVHLDDLFPMLFCTLTSWDSWYFLYLRPPEVFHMP